jgi:heptosyltransferase-2
MRILINALSGIGDAIMFSPALAVLKKHIPSSQIDMMVMYRQAEEIYRDNPAVNNIYFIDFLNQPRVKSLKQVLALRKNKYDASINVYPSNRRECNMIQSLIGAKKKIAVRYNHYSRSNWDFLNNTLKQEINDRHNVLENFDLIKFLAPDAKEEGLGAFYINIPIEEEVFAQKFYMENLLHDKFVVGLNPGSATFKGHINKRWDADKYIELAKQLHNKYYAQVMLFGTEKDVNDRIYSEIKSFAYMPQVKSIMESLALMKRCRLFVSNDTALMHLAAALKVPTTAIFGYTNYKELYPWRNKHVIVRKELECSPCFFNSPKPVQCIYTGEEEFKCIKTIEIDEVFTACNKLIEEIPGDIKARYNIK